MSSRTLREIRLAATLRVLLRAQTAWFVPATFPSFALVLVSGTCVSFQGVEPWVDFVALQVLFLISSIPLFAPGVLHRPRFVRFQLAVVSIDMLVQLGALVVHVRGLALGGAGLRTTCFRVDFGGVWYVVVVNFGGVLLFLCELVVLARLIQSGATDRDGPHVGDTPESVSR